jgi:hypothetical protein
MCEFKLGSIEALAPPATGLAAPPGLVPFGASQPYSAAFDPDKQLAVGHGLETTWLLSNGHQLVQMANGATAHAVISAARALAAASRQMNQRGSKLPLDRQAADHAVRAGLDAV